MVKQGAPLGEVRGVVRVAASAAAIALATISGLPARADPIATLLAQNIPVPEPRPAYTGDAIPLVATEETDPSPVASVTAITEKLLDPSNQPVASTGRADVKPISGSLKAGLDALNAKDARKALAIRAGMSAGSVERKVLAWAIATSGQAGIPSGEIAAIARDLPDWPSQKQMRINSERALSSEPASAQTIVKAFAGTAPQSIDGAIALARAQLDAGNAKAANAAIAPLWRGETLSEAQEKRVLSQVGKALTADDHRIRMAALFYRERVEAGLRAGELAKRQSIAKAWAAVIRDDKKAKALLDAVPAAQRKDPGYIFALVKFHRRAGDNDKAAAIILTAPKNAAELVDPDEWWVERRLISRALIDAGKAQLAYKVAAGHSAETPSVQAEAEFHAGWYALRFMNDPRRAAPHFERITKLSQTPISQARGHYWMARSLSGPQRAQHYQAAARHKGTYYGQLSAQALGLPALNISNPKPNPGERVRFASNDMVQAIVMLEEAGYPSRADAIYRHLAEKLNSAGELALLAARAEKRGNRSLALQIGKIAHQRGLEVDTVSWPVGAIPPSAKIGQTGMALAYSIARQESAFNVGAVSPANARGLLQLLPGTAKSMAKKTGQKYSGQRLVTDAAYNASLGSAYLSEQLDNFGNSYILTFVGYNAGPGRVKQWLAAYGDPRGKPIEEVVDWVERIPFTETRNYVQRVMENYQVYKARLASSKLDIEGDLRHGRR